MKGFSSLCSSVYGALRRKKLVLRVLRQRRSVVEARDGVRSNLLQIGVPFNRAIRAARATDPLAVPPPEEPDY